MSWQPPGSPEYPPTRPTSLGVHVMGAVGIGLVAGLWLFVIRAPLSRSAAAGLVFAVGSFVLLRATETPKVFWPTPPGSKAAEAARIQRWRLNGFEALTDRKPGLSPDLRKRLAALAIAIAARRHLPAGSAGVLALLGPEQHDLLFPPDRSVGDPRPDDPTREQLVRLVDRLIELRPISPSEGSR